MTDPSHPAIAVVGATGQQGGAVVDALLERHATVRALVRDQSAPKAASLAARGVETVAFDLGDPDSIAEGLAGASRAFVMTTPANGLDEETASGIRLVDGAVRAGIGHLVFSSVGGAERSTGIPHFESKRRVEEHLEGTGLAFTIVRPVFFMDNLLGTSIAADEVVVRQPLPDGVPLQMIAVGDIGRVAAAVLIDPADAPRTVEIAGDELTGSEIAAVFGEVGGVPARYEALPLDVLADNDDYRRMFAWFADTDAYEADFTETRRLDPELMDLGAWLRSTGWTGRG